MTDKGWTQEETRQLAQCLNESSVKMFTAKWCGYCTRQLDKFGDAKDSVPVVSCDIADGVGFNDKCIRMGVNMIPSWMHTDGSIRRGTMSLDEIAAFAGCLKRD